jgi:hypothetical protein
MKKKKSNSKPKKAIKKHSPVKTKLIAKKTNTVKKVAIDTTLAKKTPAKKLVIKAAKPESQYDMVFNHLVKHGSINTMQAIKLGILRLGALIFNLREGGVNIKTGVHVFVNKNGRKSTVAKYILQ